MQQLSFVILKICIADDPLSTPIHVDRFKIFYDLADLPMQPQVNLEFEHERRIGKGTEESFVNWQGFSSKHNS